MKIVRHSVEKCDMKEHTLKIIKSTANSVKYTFSVIFGLFAKVEQHSAYWARMIYAVQIIAKRQHENSADKAQSLKIGKHLLKENYKIQLK